MRRETLVRALLKVKAALAKSRAESIFNFLTRPPRPEKDGPQPIGFYTEALAGYAQFMVGYEHFGAAEKEIMDEFALSELTEPTTWITPSRSDANNPSMYAKIRHVLATFSRFSKLLQRESEEKEVVVQTVDKKAVKTLPTRKLTFFISESNAPTLTLKERFIP